MTFDHTEKKCLGKISDSTRKYTHFTYDMYLSNESKRHIYNMEGIKKYL